MVFPVVIMGIGAPGEPGMIVTNHVEEEKKEDTAPATIQLPLRGAKTALGQAVMTIIAILKTVILVTPQIHYVLK